MIKIAYHSTKSENGGFGILGKGIVEGIKANPNFKLVYDRGEYLSEDKPDVILLYGMPDLYNSVGKQLRKHYKKKIPIAFYFVWESSDLPPEFVRTYKAVDILLTATTYTAKRARLQGLNPTVWTHAIDARFKYSPRLDDGVFTFLHHNAYEFRKGWEYILEAFTNEFKEDEPVKLILKARERKQSAWLLPKDKPLTIDVLRWRRTHREEFLQSLTLGIPNVEEVLGHITDEQMVDLNNHADCFLFPAKGEGWGLPPFEAMAMGIVPILPNKGAFSEWFNKDTMLEVKTNGYINTEPRYKGYMYSISIKNLQKQMRYAFEHQEELKEMGKKGSEYIHANYNWEKVINDLYNILTARL